MSDELVVLKRKASRCKACSLWRFRKKIVFGEGSEKAKIMFIGLGPGRQENLQGRPFVGPAGKLLDSLLSLAGLKREELYITNVVKCFPPNNSPSKEQAKTCTKLYLERQLTLIKPKILITLGNLASDWSFAKFSLGFQSMQKVHGKIFEVNGNAVKFLIPMYHPAAALRNPRLRKILVEDWKGIRKFLKSK